MSNTSKITSELESYGRLLKNGAQPAINDLESSATLDDVVAAVNRILAALRETGIILRE